MVRMGSVPSWISFKHPEHPDIGSSFPKKEVPHFADLDFIPEKAYFFHNYVQIAVRHGKKSSPEESVWRKLT